jgi:hypothetical protein
MSPLIKGLAWGIGAGSVIYVLFVASQFLQAGSNKAVGIGAIVVVFTRPLFWILLGMSFCATIAYAFKHR